MAGLFDRVVDSTEKINIHYIVAGLKGYGTGEATALQVLNALNALLVENGSPVLSGQEVADLNNMAGALDAKATVQAKLVYVNKVEYAFLAAEVGQLGETGWRDALEIT